MAEEEVTKEVSVENEDNFALKKEIESLRQELSSIKQLLSNFSNTIATNQQKNPTDRSREGSAFPLFSTGNGGVPTDRQTDTQQTKIQEKDMFGMVESLKSELKTKFRSLTKQEFKVFSAIYVLEEQQAVDYRILAKHLSLTESSIRDYIMKMQQKGIPVVKTKINNKKVMLNVRQELKQLTSLDALMKIREPVFK